MLIKEVDRSSVISWSPTPKHSDLLAAGTLSGTMSTDFDTSGRLEIFSTKFSEQSPGSHMALLGSIQVKERFNRLSWKNTHPDRFKYGLLVGGFSSGNLSIWNPEAIIEYVIAHELFFLMLSVILHGTIHLINHPLC